MRVPFQKYYNLLRKYLSPFKTSVVLLSTLILVEIALKIINPQVIRYYIDQVTTTSSLQTLTFAAILYVSFAIIGQFIVIIMVYISQSISWGSTNLLRSDILQHTMHLDMEFHNKYKPGDMIERLDGDVNALSNFFSQLVLQLLSNVLLIIAILIALYLEGLVIGLVFSGFTLGGLVLAYLARTVAVPYFKKFREANMELFGFIEERISGTEDIRSLGATPNAIKKYYEFESTRFDSIMKAITISRLISVVFTGLIGFGITLVFIIGVPLYQAGSITIGTIFLMNFYVQQLVFPIFEILRQIQVLQEADASIERIEEIMQMSSRINNKGTRKLDKFEELRFEDVTFAYLEDRDVLSSVTFSLQNKERLGLIGRTGSGKTTISRLLYRFYDIHQGSIVINGVELQNYDLDSLRKRIGLVTQDVQLFNTTLRNNITFFDPSIPDDQLIEIINQLHLGQWFNELPHGLDTKISGSEVSAGQAQLIALSRIFLQNPVLVILDEASSRLDPATERVLDHALDLITKDKPTIIIAHRLSTLEGVDTIMELSFGRIAEYGPREELLKDSNSNYFKLLQAGEEVIFV